MKFKINAFAGFLIIFLFTSAAYSGQLTENQKIESLINKVQALEGAAFIRNGDPHTPQEAADHMRLKLKNAGSRIKTANDFIKYCATGSSMTGEPYKIRFKDGTEKMSADVLSGFLKEMEETASQGPSL